MKKLLLPVLLLSVQALAFEDNFDAPLSDAWDTATRLPRATLSVPTADAYAGDGQVLEMLYPGHVPARLDGPGWGLTLQTRAPFHYGRYEARLQPAAAAENEGVVSAFFTYFNDGEDHDGDGIVDNHEIDLECLAAEPSVVYLSVWTGYQSVDGIETFRKITRRIDLATGAQWQTPTGGEGAYTLEPIEDLVGWTHFGTQVTGVYHRFGFDWQPTHISFWIDLEEGAGPFVLWRLEGPAGQTIPSHPAPCYLNVWHNANHWNTDQPARPPARSVNLRVDWVSIEEALED